MCRSFAFLALTALLGGGTGPLRAQAPGDTPRPPFVRATGDAVVQAPPDQARIEIGVITQAPTAQEAAARNAKQVETVLAQLRRLVGTNGDIRTVNYSLHPDYQYPPGGQPKLIGYRASNTVQITTNDLAGLGKLIDAAAQAGANQVQQLQFTLRNEAAARDEALKNATREARSKAAAMVAALGLKLGKLISLEEVAGPPVRPVRDVAMMAARAETPVQPGSVDIRATVTLTYAVE